MTRRSVTPLPERFWQKVEKTNDHWLWTGSVDHRGYGTINKGRRGEGMIRAHRLSYELASGLHIPPGLMIDHDHLCPKRCVNPSHLRLVTNKQNQENRATLERGACYCKRTGWWMATVTHNKRTVWAGRHKTKTQALEAARLKRIEIFTHNDLDRETTR